MNGSKLKFTTPSEREIAMTRVFDAPASMVFDAWTKPELIKRWLGRVWRVDVSSARWKVASP